MNRPNSRWSKIVFVNRFFYPDHSATSQILSDLAFELARHGRTVEVVTSRMRYDDAGADLPAFEVRDGVKIHRVWSTRFGRTHLHARAIDYLSFYISAAAALCRHVDRQTVLVAKTDPPMISVIAAPVAKLRGARLINWLQDLFPEVAGVLGMRAFQGLALKLLRFARNVSLRNATNVVLGQRMRALLEAEGVPADRVRVIPNWADGETVRPIAHKCNALRDEWKLVDSFVVAYSGNLGRAHEFETILGAAELLTHRSDVLFLFIGAGAQLRAVEDQVRQRQLPNVRFQAYQPRERLALSLGVGDAHLVSLNPALEGLIVPSKFYGIAAAGRPTLFVGDPAGEIAATLREHNCGRTVSTGDSQTLADTIIELASNPLLCNTLGSNARRVFESRFDRKLAFQSWTLLLDEGAALRSPVADRSATGRPESP